MIERIKKELRGLNLKLIALVVAVELVIISLLVTTAGASYLAYSYHNELLIERDRVVYYEDCIEGINSGEIEPSITIEDASINLYFNCR